MQQAFLVFVNTILLAGNLVATCIFLALTFRQLRGDHGDKDYLLCILCKYVKLSKITTPKRQ